MAKPGGMKKKCEKYKNQARLEKNKDIKQKRHEKRMQRFADRKQAGKTYEYSKDQSSHKQESNKCSRQPRHTEYCKLESLFAKLDLEMNRELAAERERERKMKAK